jgi:hypothetical protein
MNRLMLSSWVGNFGSCKCWRASWLRVAASGIRSNIPGADKNTIFRSKANSAPQEHTDRPDLLMWIAVAQVGQSTSDQGHAMFVIPSMGWATLIYLSSLFA